MKLKSSLFLLLLLFTSSVTFSQDKLSETLKSALHYQMEALSKQDLPPYYIDLRVVNSNVNYVQSSFGAVMAEGSNESTTLLPHIRVGNRDFDNFYYTSQSRTPLKNISLFDINETVVRDVIWRAIDDAYPKVKSSYSGAKANYDVNIKQEDKAPNFAQTPIETYFEAPLTGAKYEFDAKLWRERANKYSGMFTGDDNIINGTAVVQFTKNRKYFVSTEGASVVQNETYAILMVSATTKAEDGMELPLNLSYFAFTPDGLPATEKVEADVKDMIAKLSALRVAPIVSPYAGPALLSGAASGVFFHEIFGHRIEGQRMKTDTDGQTFKAMVGKILLPKAMQVYDDPSLKNYNGSDLNGYFNYDDQGVKGRRVDVIKDGILNEFLMSRTAIDGFPVSNGHGRAAIGYDPTTRQSNLVIETKDHKSEAELREILIKEIKRQNKPFGYYFKQVSAGLAFTGAGQVNSFNVTPLEVYRVYVDGRADELVRGVDMIGTPLSIFENISYAGGDAEIFTGTCGAESGPIPVTAISPMLLVNKVEVQRKDKNKNQPPLLPKPSQK